MEDIFLKQCKRSKSLKQRIYESGGVRFSNPFIVFYEGRTYRQPQVVFISLPQAATGLRFACRARFVGGTFSRTISWRPVCAAECTLRGALRAELLMPQEVFFTRQGRRKWRYFILQ